MFGNGCITTRSKETLRTSVAINTTSWIERRFGAERSKNAVESKMRSKTNPIVGESWRQSGARKICLKIDNLNELQRLAGQAQSAGLVTHLVKDAGHTEVEPVTITVLGIGPGPRRSIDALVGELKPY